MDHKRLIISNYKKLLNKYSRQGWWPTTPLGQVTPRYYPKRSVRGRSEPEMLEICVGAILAQNTAWLNVMKALESMQRGCLLSISQISRVPLGRLARLIRPSGYFNQKSIRIKYFIEYIKIKYKGKIKPFLSQNPLKNVREELLQLNGIGPETADSMLLYAGGRPLFVVDSYTRRIGERWGILTGQESYEDVQSVFMSALPKSPDIYGEYHALLVELAKQHCRKKPICDGCPVRTGCNFGAGRK